MWIKRSLLSLATYFLLEHLLTGINIRKGDGAEKVTQVLLYEIQSCLLVGNLKGLEVKPLQKSVNDFSCPICSRSGVNIYITPQ